MHLQNFPPYKIRVIQGDVMKTIQASAIRRKPIAPTKIAQCSRWFTARVSTIFVTTLLASEPMSHTLPLAASSSASRKGFRKAWKSHAPRHKRSPITSAAGAPWSANWAAMRFKVFIFRVLATLRNLSQWMVAPNAPSSNTLSLSQIPATWQVGYMSQRLIP